MVMEDQSIIHDLLQSALDDLRKDDFKRFKDKLSHSAFEGKGPIPQGHLENADTIDTKNLLMKFYSGAAAVDVTMKVFTWISLQDSADKLRVECEKALGPQQTPETSANAYRVKYSRHIKYKHSRIQDMNARLGETVKLNSRYTKLIIVNEHCQKEQRKHEIMALGQRHEKSMTKRDSPITISDLFKSDGNEPSPQVVVLQGAAGIGKTLTSRKIMLDWANGELYQTRFDYVFYINCRENNFVTEQKSVEDLILKNCPDQNAPIKEILMTPEKLLFIIDGFDELRFSFNHSESNFPSDPSEKQPVDIILSSLLRRNVLQQSHLLITTRPTALEKLKQCLKEEHCTYAEILGFSEKERKEYFDKFFGNEKRAKKAYNFVKGNKILFTMCFVPIACWIICTVLKQQMDVEEDLAQTSTTITGIYIFYLLSLLKHHSNSKQEARDNIKGLCSLAVDGIWRQKILFEEDDVRKYGLDKLDSLFLNENMFQKVTDCECLYSFIHLSFQEFFAALFYMLENEERVEISENGIQPVEELFEKWGKSSNYLMLTVQFLFGLLNKERLKDLEKELNCKISPKIKNNVLTWIKEQIFFSLFKPKHVFSPEIMNFSFEYFHYLYEIQEIEFVQNSMNLLNELILTSETLTQMDQIVLSFCIKNCSTVESLWIKSSEFLTEDLHEDLPVSWKRPRWEEHQNEPHHSPVYLLCQALKDPNCKLKKLKWHDYLTPAYCGDIADVLRDSQSLTELDLSGRREEVGVQLLCKGLEHPNCKLQKLRLRICYLSRECCRDLANVLKASHSLIELNLKGSFDLDYDGVRLLCKGLRHTGCKLQRLNLKSCGLQGTCYGNLATVLKVSQSLTDLNLGENYLEDAGVQLLCEGLRHPNCKLQRLCLDGCFLTASCCEFIAAALRTNKSLIDLNLWHNDLGDPGVQLLCEALTENCTLQILNLGICGLTASCCEFIAAALRTNQSLIELDLSVNELGDHGVQMLCEGLKQNCKLQSLKLGECWLTESCCENLAAVLRTNQSLIELDLSGNDLGDRGVHLLCEGTKQKCKLQILNFLEVKALNVPLWKNFSHCDLTDSCCEDLTAAFRTSQSLIELNLSFTGVGDHGVQLLCEELIQNCKFENLKLRQCGVTGACCGALATVLSTSQTLTYLNIQGIRMKDSEMQQLCEGLKHPNCKLQTLRIGYCHLTPEMLKQLYAVKKMKPDFNIKGWSKKY